MLILYHLLLLHCFTVVTLSENDATCSSSDLCSENGNKYDKESNQWISQIRKHMNIASAEYEPCIEQNCSCHKSVIDQDLAPFRDGITHDMFLLAQAKATKYQIFNGILYRQKDCHFPARCAGVEHYLSALAPKLPNMELMINTRDWPQVNHAWGHVKAPVFSFSKTKDYYDIMYPAWSFWEGGPAISLYPTGIGRWDRHRLSISAAAERWPWSKKVQKAFFRGSRTSEERDALILLSRAEPNLVDAQYTKNQAWKSEANGLINLFLEMVLELDHIVKKCSMPIVIERRIIILFERYNNSKSPELPEITYFVKDKTWSIICNVNDDTLYAEPAAEVSFEDHCKYKYLFNYRGVAASFRLKHLFLCKSLVFHVGNDWQEFFYPSLKPWMHYIPISPTATQSQIAKYIHFFKENDSLAKEIAQRGYEMIWETLSEKDVKCYWRKLLKKYAKLLKYDVVKDEDLIKIS